MIRQSTSRVSQVLPADFAFSRASTGYNTKGKLYMPNQLRLESSIYGGAMASIEEATTNLWDVQPASIDDFTTKSGVIWSNGVYFGDNSVTRYAYRTIPTTIPTKFTISVNVKMDDLSMPVLGAPSSPTSDFGFVIGGDDCDVDGYSIVYLGNNVYRVSGKYTVNRTSHCGIVKYTTQSAKSFTVVGNWQLEQKPYPTSFTETSRAAESLTMPVLATNLLTVNQASVEQGLTGFLKNAGTETLSKDTTTYKYGNASLKVVTPGNVASEGFLLASLLPVTASLSYTASVWLKGSGTIKLTLYEYTSGSALVGSTITEITLTDIWTRYSATRTFGLTGVYTRMAVTTLTTQATTFYADGLQLELGPYATTWNIPTGELVPRMGLPVEHGTIEGIVEITDIVKRTSGNRGIINIPSTTLSYGIILYCPNGSSNFNLGTFTDATTFKEVTILSSLIPNGWYYYKIYWTVSEAIVEFWDLSSQTKVASATISDPTLPAAFATNAHLGAYTASTYFANTRFGKHQLPNIARTDDPDFNNLMPRDSNTVALMDFDDITFRANQCMVV
jgi:hypothetical protein